MNFNFKIIKALVALMVMNNCCDLIASSVGSYTRRAGRTLAPAIAQQGFKSTSGLVTYGFQSSYNQFKPKNYQYQPSAQYLSTQKTVASQESNLDMAKWLIAVAAAVAGDLAYEDYKQNKYDFLKINPKNSPGDRKTLIAYFQYKFQDAEFIDLDAEHVAYAVSSKSSYESLNSFLELSKKIAQKNGRYFVTLKDVYKAMTGERSNERGSVFVAYHEAGHALIDCLFLDKIKSDVLVTIDQEKAIFSLDIKSDGGDTYSIKNIEAEAPLSRRITYLIDSWKLYKMELTSIFAGGVAAQLSSPHHKKFNENDLDDFDEKKYELRYSSDFYKAEKVAEEMVTVLILLDNVLSGDLYIAKELFKNSRRIAEGSEKINKIFLIRNQDKLEAKKRKMLQETFAQAVRLVNEHQSELKKIADLLLEKGTISGQEVYDILGKQAPLLDFQYDRMVDEVEQYFNYQ